MKLVKGFVLNLFYQVWSREIELRKDMDKKTMANLTFFFEQQQQQQQKFRSGYSYNFTHLFFLFLEFFSMDKHFFN